MSDLSDLMHIPLEFAVDVQDDLMTVCTDLDRLQVLLADTCRTLMIGLDEAHHRIESLTPDQALAERELIDFLRPRLIRAVTALQFQDMSSQLIEHAQRRLRHCGDRLAQAAFADDDGIVEPAPRRASPVTQSEMDAGSVELF